jgi:hypothetical protein
MKLGHAGPGQQGSGVADLGREAATTRPVAMPFARPQHIRAAIVRIKIIIHLCWRFQNNKHTDHVVGMQLGHAGAGQQGSGVADLGREAATPRPSARPFARPQHIAATARVADLAI